jgi:hypothetical protein
MMRFTTPASKDSLLNALLALSPLFVATFRDWVIIFTGIAIAAFFVVLLIITIMLGLLARLLMKKSISVLDDSVKPLLSNVNETATHAKGTASFVSQAAVTPIVRTYGVVAGVRRAAGVLAGLTGASTDRTRKPKP